MELRLQAVANPCLPHWLAARHRDVIPPERIWGTILSRQSDVLGAGCSEYHVSHRISVETLEHVKLAWRHFAFPCSMVWAELTDFGIGGAVLWDALLRDNSSVNGPERGAMAAAAVWRTGENVDKDDAEGLLPHDTVQDTCYQPNKRPASSDESNDDVALEQRALEAELPEDWSGRVDYPSTSITADHPSEGATSDGPQRGMQAVQCEPCSRGALGGGQTLEHADKNIFAYDVIREAYEDTEESVGEELVSLRCTALQSMIRCYGLPWGCFDYPSAGSIADKPSEGARSGGFSA